MATIPAASPSSPSIRLTALVIRHTHATVMSGSRSAESEMKPANGTWKKNIVTPNR